MTRLAFFITTLVQFIQAVKFDPITTKYSKFQKVPRKFIQNSKPIKKPTPNFPKPSIVDDSTCEISTFFNQTVRLESVDRPGFYSVCSKN